MENWFRTRNKHTLVALQYETLQGLQIQLCQAEKTE